MSDVEDHFDDEEELSPEEAEARISEFIDSTDAAGGPPTAELAEQALAIVAEAWDKLGLLTGAQVNNKVISMMLFVSARTRELDPVSSQYWINSATSTLLSGQIPAAGVPVQRNIET